MNIIFIQMNVLDRILHIKNELGYKSDGEFADAIDINRSNFSQMKRGNRTIGDNILNKISVQLNISKNWLLTGEGSMFKEETNNPNDMLTTNLERPTGYYYPDVSASAGLNMRLENTELQKIPVSIPGWDTDMVFINVYGDSMYPKYNSGEIIAIKEVDFEFINYGFPYVVVFKNGDVYIKYIKKGKEKNHILLVSENKFYDPKEFHLDLIRSVYSIKGVIKKELM